MKERAILTFIAVIMAVSGATILQSAWDGLTVRDTVVDGVALTEVRSSTSIGESPGVVWRTASRGSARLMRSFADTLARRGFVVVLFDLAGHGRNTSGSGRDEVDVAVRHLRSLSGVDGARSRSSATRWARES